MVELKRAGIKLRGMLIIDIIFVTYVYRITM